MATSAPVESMPIADVNQELNRIAQRLAGGPVEIGSLSAPVARAAPLAGRAAPLLAVGNAQP